MGQSHISVFLLLTVIFYVGHPAFPHINNRQAIMQFYQQNSLKVILHICYDRHFGNSRQFENLETVLNDLEEESGDYLTIAFTDCEKDTELELKSCQQMKRTKDNRQILAVYPSSQFIRMGNLQIQSPPQMRILEHYSDVYDPDNLKNQIVPLLPNFFKELHNKQEYDDFLKPRYSPKLLVFLREDEEEDLPLVLKELSLYFALRMDFGLVYDLNDEVMEIFKGDVKKFPTIQMLKYNYETNQYVATKYDQSVLSTDNYERIKEFLEKFALKQNRNDFLFHKIAMETQSEIITVESQPEYTEIQERASGWMITVRTSPESPIPEALKKYQSKYGNYYSYVHFRDPNKNSDSSATMFLYSPTEESEFEININEEKLGFYNLNAEDFVSNMTLWLNKDYVVVGVNQQYGYLCGITDKTLFRGHTRCLIIKQEEQQKLKQLMKLQYNYGFIIRRQPEHESKNVLWDDTEELKQQILKKKKVTKGVKLSSTEFQTVYRQLEFGTRMKLKQMLDQFIAMPINEPSAGVSLREACFHPSKKCFILLTDLSKKDRTIQDYIKELAINYIANYQFLQLDINANRGFLKEIGFEKSSKNDLIVFYPKSQEFVRLNKKITKGMIEKFLRANRVNDKRLKRVKLGIQAHEIILNPANPNQQAQSTEL